MTSTRIEGEYAREYLHSIAAQTNAVASSSSWPSFVPGLTIAYRVSSDGLSATSELYLILVNDCLKLENNVERDGILRTALVFFLVRADFRRLP